MRANIGRVLIVLAFTFLSAIDFGCAKAEYDEEVSENGTKPDLANPEIINRARFTMKYPGNWNIRKDLSSFDPDNNFTISTCAEGMVMFQMLAINKLEPEAKAEADKLPKKMAEALAKLMNKNHIENGRESKFGKWGKHRGYGIKIKGTISGTPGVIRVFSFKEKGLVITVMETRNLDDDNTESAGFDLIADTFKLKTAK